MHLLHYAYINANGDSAQRILHAKICYVFFRTKHKIQFTDRS